MGSLYEMFGRKDVSMLVAPNDSPPNVLIRSSTSSRTYFVLTGAPIHPPYCRSWRLHALTATRLVDFFEPKREHFGNAGSVCFCNPHNGQLKTVRGSFRHPAFITSTIAWIRISGAGRCDKSAAIGPPLLVI